ncbi:MAG: polyprenyltransferase [Balneolaceae bacterium]|nr:MAG: polyprenyltransferase [Balneolaceae bacterium]
MRPPNIITAFADILAGFAAAGGILIFTGAGILIEPAGLGWLLMATFGLYGGGVVFNDVFDARLDAKERPERPIPSGRISRVGASVLGSCLYLVGVVSAFQVNPVAGWLSVVIVFLTLAYDIKAKHSPVFGPLFMGLCRGGNLLLGAAILPQAIGDIWFLLFFPVIYIGSITLVSRGEVSGGSSLHGKLAFAMILLVITGLPALTFLVGFDVLTALPFLIFFAIMVLPSFYRVSVQPEAGFIKKAVKRGVISLVLMNSVIAAGFSGIILGIIVLGVFVGSIVTARLFAVT